MRKKEREADQMQYNARLEELQKERVREQEVLSSRFEEERQRLVSNFETLQATLQVTMEGRYKEQIADLTTKLAETSLQVRQLIQAEVNPMVSLMASQATNRGPRQRLEAVKSFSGEKRDYAMWKVDILAKLLHDGEAIGSPTAQFHYVYSRLDNVPKSYVTAFVRQLEKGDPTPEALLADLDQNYVDRNEAERASSKLRQLRQGPEKPLSRFLPRFNALMSTSEVKDHGDGAKIMMLRDALNDRMSWALIGKSRPTTYRAYKDFVLELSSEIEGLTIKSDRPAQHGDYGGEPMDMRAGGPCGAVVSTGCANFEAEGSIPSRVTIFRFFTTNSKATFGLACSPSAGGCFSQLVEHGSTAPVMNRQQMLSQLHLKLRCVPVNLCH